MTEKISGRLYVIVKECWPFSAPTHLKFVRFNKNYRLNVEKCLIGEIENDVDN